MNSIKIILGLVAVMSACAMFSAPAPFPLTISSRADSAPPVSVFCANEASFLASFVDGATPSDLTNMVPYMEFTTNVNSSSVSTSSYQIVSLAEAKVKFTFSPSQLNAPSGRYVYEIGVRSGGTTRTYRQGVFLVHASPSSGGASQIDWTTPINWSTVSWIGLPSYALLTDVTTAAGTVVDARESGLSVLHAGSAGRLKDPVLNSWTAMVNGTATTFRVTQNLNAVRIVSAGVGYNGPPVGTVFTFDLINGDEYQYVNGVYAVIVDAISPKVSLEDLVNEPYPRWLNDAVGELPATIPAEGGGAVGSCVIDYAVITNSEALTSKDYVDAAIEAIPDVVVMPVSKVYSPVDPLVIVVTNQSQVICNLDKNLTIGAPIITGIADGQTVRWRFTAVGANRTIYWPTNTIFSIPRSSEMTTNNIIESGTTSIYATEYNQTSGKWQIEAYVWGY